MSCLIIEGDQPLRGDVDISGSKNATLPILAASLLIDSFEVHNVPYLKDCTTMLSLLSQMGAEVCFKEDATINIQCGSLSSHIAPYELVRAMRASILVLGPLLARFGKAQVSLPGGCDIGGRPVDIHIHALTAMGANIQISEGFIEASVEGRLKGTHYCFEKQTVTGTENVLMAATLAEGESVLENCATEPEIQDLALCLVAMGAEIEGIGTTTLRIQGKQSLHDHARYSIMNDRIEAGTYLLAAAATKGYIVTHGLKGSYLTILLDKLRDMGISISTEADRITLDARDRQIKAVDITTGVYPAFPTDLQPQFTVLSAIAQGTSIVRETVFESRLRHCSDLQRMGVDVSVKGDTAYINGGKELSGAPMEATNLRTAAAFVIAGLAAKGMTAISETQHLYRGYERVYEKLKKINAAIEINSFECYTDITHKV